MPHPGKRGNSIPSYDVKEKGVGGNLEDAGTGRKKPIHSLRGGEEEGGPPSSSKRKSTC